METPTYIALSRQLTLRRELDVIANNIANMNTPAFKAERMVFVEFLEQPSRDEKLSFVQDLATARDVSEGPIKKTDNTFDLAISGDGYFSIESPNGERYTRHGRFQLDADGQLVTSQGYPVLSDDGNPISIPTDAGVVTIAPDGTINVGSDDVFLAEPTQVGKIGVVSFEDQQALQRAANNLYIAGDEEPLPVDEPQIVQGMLEDSNVQGILEMTRMMSVLRSYEGAARFIKSEHDRAMRAINRITRAASN
tara:strand:- start:37 stop:789 length:753 start_codon:yes stop_codon:yes gene_type:complete